MEYKRQFYGKTKLFAKIKHGENTVLICKF